MPVFYKDVDMSGIQIKQVVKRFGDTEVIPTLDLDVKEGEFLVFVGPSGCGKSTLLRMVAGLESTSGGEIWIGGQRVDHLGPADRGAAMVFQSYALYPHMTVEQNMGFALRMSGKSKAEIREQVGAAADKLKLTALLSRYPKQLSGGQRQRVAIGRAIVRRPSVFLFDEPLSNLDAALRVEMRIELAKLHADLGTTMIYVTHDQTEAMTLGDRIAVFNQGRIEQLGRPLDLYQQPRNRFVAEFLGSPKINLLTIESSDADGVVLNGGTRLGAADLGLTQEKISQARVLGVRPEAWQVVQAQTAALKGKVEFVEHLGDAVIAYVRLPGQSNLLTVKTHAQAVSLALSQDVYLMPQVEEVLVFDAAGHRI
jgi:ABC-type sugar transport system ATPase subunit